MLNVEEILSFNLEEMLAAGFTVDQIKEYVEKEAAKIEAQKKNSQLSKFREKAVFAIFDYFVELGVISKDKLTKEDIEGAIRALENSEKDIVEMTKMLKMLEKLSGNKRKAPVMDKNINLNNSKVDEEVLKRFLAGL